jgi:hypothetical protein
LVCGNVDRDALLDLFLASGICATRNFFAAVLVSLSEVSFGYRYFAVRAVTELDTSIAAGKVGANELFSVLDILGNDKVGRLEV